MYEVVKNFLQLLFAHTCGVDYLSAGFLGGFIQKLPKSWKTYIVCYFNILI